MTKLITKIEQQKKNKHRYSLYINEEFAFGVSEDTLVKHQLRKGMELEEDFIENVLESEEKNKAISYGLNLLSYRMRSEKEVRDKMREKEYGDDMIDVSIKYLLTNKYLDDLEFAKCFVKDKINFKKIGENRLKQELYYKGVNKDIIESVLEELLSEEDEYEKASALAQKKLETSYRKDDRNKQYQKLFGFLSRKGYPSNMISRILRELL
ncbi:MAG: RecX family transcriptional regulator [Clostridiaceae bacterium]|nr:RecX family transcriptional regulator [Clostridiaceae bacterium]